jgi:hypothetical protein
MPKRFKGGFITSTPTTTNTLIAKGVWSLADQLQGLGAGVWPVTASPVTKTGTTTYDVTSLGPVTYISEIASNAAVMNALPGSGFLRYSIKVLGGALSITVSYRKRDSVTLIQSAFSLFGQTLAYVDSGVSTILNAANDDHDTLFMDADGRGVLSRTQTSVISVGSYTKFAGTTTVAADNAIDSVVTYPVASFIGNTQFGTLISFPLTTSSIWINLSNGTYKTNNFMGASLPGSMASTLSTTAPTNSLFTISDGVNQFIISRYATGSSAFLCKVDLNTGTMTATSIMYGTSIPAGTNATEEDAIGTQLFAVDGYTTLHKDKIFYYGGNYDWIDTTTTPLDTGTKLSFSAGPGSTQAVLQTDADIFGSVDPSDRSVWFADWGHDDGGLYNVGNDIELGTRKTNIKLIPTNYTN